MNFVYEWSHRQALIAEGSQVISKPNFPDETDAEDSTEDYLWEDFQSACDCIESNCVHEKMAEKDLEALEKKLYEQERADVLNGNDPFQFDEINEMEETMPKEKAEIKIGFLMVGHTHEDVDQLFSRISKRLSKNNACTVDELSSQIKESYNPEVNVISLRHLFNITPWLEPLFNDFSGHSDPHQFKLEKGANGEVNFSYKKWSTRKVWKTGEDGYFPILKSDVDLSKLKPPGTVQVSLEKVGIQKLSTDISKYKLRFSSQTQNWWRSYIEDLTQRQAHSDQYRGEWLLDTLVRSNQDIQQSIPITLLTAEEQKELEDLERMYNKERTEKEVKLKGKRKIGGRKRKFPINAGTATKPRLGKRKNTCNNKGKPKNAKRKKTCMKRSMSWDPVSNPEGPGPVVAAVKGSVSLASRSISVSVSGIVEQDEKTKICVNDEMPSNGNSFMTHTLSTLHM
ncbi:hypothetical protein AC249_AIPGENE10502 [Exaiptasia diaphana]|nr:hypothetical protein AC249_AIPGENE10502 [Exaiptasia diaphana]